MSDADTSTVRVAPRRLTLLDDCLPGTRVYTGDKLAFDEMFRRGRHSSVMLVMPPIAPPIFMAEQRVSSVVLRYCRICDDGDNSDGPTHNLCGAHKTLVNMIAQRKEDEAQQQLIAHLQRMTRDLNTRVSGAMDSVRHFQGMAVAGQFKKHIQVLIQKFGQQEDHILRTREDKLPEFRERLELIRIELLEAMSAIRGVQPSAWAWPEVTVAARDKSSSVDAKVEMDKIFEELDALDARFDKLLDQLCALTKKLLGGKSQILPKIPEEIEALDDKLSHPFSNPPPD